MAASVGMVGTKQKSSSSQAPKWLMLVIKAMQEAEIKRIAVPS
jgi:hypothetical protein